MGGKVYIISDLHLGHKNMAIYRGFGSVEDTGEIYNPRGKELWSILIGESQGKMNWVWTSEEVFGRIREKYKDE